MSNHKIDVLFELIKSLSSSEKKVFRIYISRIKYNYNAKFIRLFNIINKIKNYDEIYIIQKTSINKIQLSNIKAYLYKKILTSLRLQNTYVNPEIQANEYFDFAKILYDRGLYIHSIKYLKKAKLIAFKHMLFIIMFDILIFEKNININYFNNNFCNKINSIINESNILIKIIKRIQIFSNIYLKLYFFYLKIGHIKNLKDKIFIRYSFKEGLSRFKNLEKLNMYEKLILHKCHVWYYYILQEFKLCYKYLIKYKKLLEYNQNLKIFNIVNYIKCYSTLLKVLFYLNKYYKFICTLKEFDFFLKKNYYKFNNNVIILIFIFNYNNKMYRHFMEGTFSEGVKIILPKFFRDFKKFEQYLDKHYLIVLYYNIAFLYFGSGDYISSIQYLIKIIDIKENVSLDFQCFARILYIISCYEAGLYEKLNNNIKSVYNFLLKINYWKGVQRIILNFIKNLMRFYPCEIKKQFKKLKKILIEKINNPYEKNIFIHLNIISWVSSKIENKSIETIIKENFLKKKN